MSPNRPATGITSDSTGGTPEVSCEVVSIT